MATLDQYIQGTNPYNPAGWPGGQPLSSQPDSNGQVYVKNLDTGQMEPAMKVPYTETIGNSDNNRQQVASWVYIPRSQLAQFTPELQSRGMSVKDASNAVQINTSFLQDMADPLKFAGMVMGGANLLNGLSGAFGGAAGAEQAASAFGLDAPVFGGPTGAEQFSSAFGLDAPVFGGPTGAEEAASAFGLDVPPAGSGVSGPSFSGTFNPNVIPTGSPLAPSSTINFSIPDSAPSVAGTAAGSAVTTGAAGAGTAGAGTTGGAMGATGAAPNSLSSYLSQTTGLPAWAFDAAGKIIPGLIGAYASGQQADALKALADQQLAVGAPSRARYEASFAPGFDVTQDPALKSALEGTSDTLLRRLSAGQGNPFGDPGGLIEANKSVMNNVALPYLNTYRNQNASTGGYGAFSTAAPQTQMAGIGADSNIWNALGSSAANVFNPQPTLADLLKQMKSTGINTGTSL